MDCVCVCVLEAKDDTNYPSSVCPGIYYNTAKEGVSGELHSPLSIVRIQHFFRE